MSNHDPNDDDDEADKGRPPGHRPERSGFVDLGINVGLQSLTDLLEGLDPGGASRPDRWRDELSVRPSADEEWREPGPDDDRTVPPTDDYLVDTQRSNDELVVSAELPGVSEDDLTVGVDVESNDFVILVSGHPIERVALPWSSTEAAKVWFNNGVLEVRLEPKRTQGDEGET